MGKKIYYVIIPLCVSIFCTNISPKLIYAQDKAKLQIAMMEDDLENQNKEENKSTSSNPKNTSWNLYALYKSQEDWNKELRSFEKDTKELNNYIGKVTKSKTHLVFALDIKEKLDARINRLYAFVNLHQDINKKSYKYLDMKETMNKVASNYSAICSDLELEILRLPKAEYEKVMSDPKVKKKYGMYLENIKRFDGYYLDGKSEDLLSHVSPLASLPGQVYELFRNMDKKSNLNPSQYATAMQSGDREERKLAYQNELIPYNDNINTLSGLLVGQVKKNKFYASERGYKSSLEMYLKSDDVDIKVYDKLIETVNKNISGLHDYISLRKKVLGLDKVHSYDIAVPIINIKETNIPYEKAQGILYSALSPLGKEYSDIVYKAFNERWVDVYSNDDKVSGAYCLSVYDVHPYILVNYNNSLSSVSTLAHEIGHAAYEYMSSKNQNYFNSNPTIFTHEVASTTNEALLYEVLIRNTSDKDQKAYYITEYLDLIKNTLYIQTMYAEFETTIHSLVEEGKSVNALVLNDVWGGLLKKYYGKDYELDQLSKVGWARIPHFYNSFYVYKYATGCSAGVSFAQQILKDGSDNYINFLKRGSSDYPSKLLKDAGVDLTTTEPIENTIDKFNYLVKELEKIVENK